MEMHYCWRCKCDVPMLDDVESDIFEPLIKQQLENIKIYRAKHECSISEAIGKIDKPATDKYLQITGYQENDCTEIAKHQLKKFGIQCPSCARLLRTPNATICAECFYSLPR